MRRTARGLRPSCLSTIATSSIRSKRTVGLAPGGDPLDDEQPLAGLDERESPGLERERGRARRGRHPALELALLGLEPAHLLAPTDERVPRVQVGAERPEVE